MNISAVLSFALSSALLTASAASYPTSRDPLEWPFAQNSIWNMPIGSDAVYVPANIPPPDTREPLNL